MRAYEWKRGKRGGLRGLGEGEPVHTRWAGETASKASAAAVAAANFAQDGSCTVALKSLLQAHGWLGAAVAHSQSGARGVALGPVTTTVGRADDAVLKACKVRSPNGDSAVSGIDTPLGPIRTRYLIALGAAVALYLASRKK